jgi:hypothetical protein
MQTPEVTRCPLCAGPLRASDEEMVCEEGHTLTPQAALDTLVERLVPALWAAIRALEDSAHMQRWISGQRAAGQSTWEGDEAAARALRDYVIGVEKSLGRHRNAQAEQT